MYLILSALSVAAGVAFLLLYFPLAAVPGLIGITLSWAAYKSDSSTRPRPPVLLATFANALVVAVSILLSLTLISTGDSAVENREDRVSVVN